MKSCHRETAEFINIMIDRLMDLQNRRIRHRIPGYLLGNYFRAVYFFQYERTDHDVKVLQYEAGSCFQAYEKAGDLKFPEYSHPTLESAETHSMSMEFITLGPMDGIIF